MLSSYEYKTTKIDNKSHTVVYKNGKLLSTILHYYNKQLLDTEFKRTELEIKTEGIGVKSDTINIISQFDILARYHKGLSFEKCEELDDLLMEGFSIYLITEDDGVTVIDSIIYDFNPCLDEECSGQLISGTKDSYIQFCFNDNEID